VFYMSDGKLRLYFNAWFYRYAHAA
jgi:hypothetical protein